MCHGQPCPDMHAVFWGVALMIVIPIITGALGIGQSYYANVVGLRVMQDLRNALYRHLQHMPLRFFTSTRTGEIQSRLSNDVGGVQTVVTDTASSILSNVVVIISHAGRHALPVRAAHAAVAVHDAVLPVAHGQGGPGAARGRGDHAAVDGRHDRGHRGDAVGERHPAVEGVRSPVLRDRAVPAENERLTGLQVRQR